jgi:cellulose synthase/poly-beta-1,6-N-acetylglucosamine synthase-like glycosyltransferase
LLLLAFLFFCLFTIFQLVYIIIPLLHLRPKDKPLHTTSQSPITILVPAYNEEASIHHCIEGITSVTYKHYEAIIINDGSTDATLEVLHGVLDLSPVTKPCTGRLLYKPIRNIFQSRRFPQLYVIDKTNGGKADALNAGIDYAQHGVVVTLDADSILGHNSLHAVNVSFEDHRIVAAGGTVHITQGTRGESCSPTSTFKVSNLLRYQVLQYMTAFYLYKFTQSYIGALTVISGAFGVFRKHLLFEIGGFRKSLGEDMDITLRIQRFISTRMRRKKIVYISLKRSVSLNVPKVLTIFFDKGSAGKKPLSTA